MTERHFEISTREDFPKVIIMSSDKRSEEYVKQISSAIDRDVRVGNLNVLSMHDDTLTSLFASIFSKPEQEGSLEMKLLLKGEVVEQFSITYDIEEKVAIIEDDKKTSEILLTNKDSFRTLIYSHLPVVFNRVMKRWLL